MIYLNFIELTKDFQKHNKNIYEQPIDWNTACYSNITILSTKFNNMLIFEIETEEEKSIFGGYLPYKEIPIADKTIFIPYDDYLENETNIELAYNFLCNNEKLLDVSDTKNYTCQKYLDQLNAQKLDYIKFKSEVTLANIFMEHIFYCLDFQHKDNIDESDIENINIIKEVIRNLDSKHYEAIVTFFGYKREIHTFGDLYTYVEQFCLTKEQSSYDNLCENCLSTLSLCATCAKKEKIYTSVCWKSTETTLKKYSTFYNIKLDTKYKLYGKLKEIRNSIFHHKPDKDIWVKVVQNSFSMYIYALLFTLYALTNKSDFT